MPLGSFIQPAGAVMWKPGLSTVACCAVAMPCAAARRAVGRCRAGRAGGRAGGGRPDALRGAGPRLHCGQPHGVGRAGAAGVRAHRRQHRLGLARGRRRGGRDAVLQAAAARRVCAAPPPPPPPCQTGRRASWWPTPCGRSAALGALPPSAAAAARLARPSARRVGLRCSPRQGGIRLRLFQMHKMHLPTPPTTAAAGLGT